MRIRLDLAYDGTAFSGWAAQRGQRTVQGEVETALGRILRLEPPPRLTVAGRTDAGVHARGQVAHVDLPWAAWRAVPGGSTRTPAESLVTRLSALLPPDAVVHRVAVAPPGFDARFSALWRRYRYRIADDFACRDPLRRADVLWYRRRLDVPAMDLAGRGLLGEHDFAAFCRPRPGSTTVRELQGLHWERSPDGLAVADVRADAFCHSMVRAIVGASLAVGEGRRPPSWLADVLIGGTRDPGVAVAPAHGLTLEEVRYVDDGALAARAQLTRAVRTLPGAGRRGGRAVPASRRPAGG